MTPAQQTIIASDPFAVSSWRNGDLTPAQQTVIVTAIAAVPTAMTVGNAVGGGVANRVLYVGAGGVLAQSTGLTWNDGLKKLAVVGSGATTAQTIVSGAAGTALSISVSGAGVGIVIAGGGTSTAASFTNGSFSVTICDTVNAISYTPGDPTSWAGTAPTDVWVALDRCAALLKTLNSGTGP